MRHRLNRTGGEWVARATVVVDGRILRRKSQFTALDHAKVLHEANAAFRSVLERMVVPT